MPQAGVLLKCSIIMFFVLADSLEEIKEIDVERAKNAKERAEDRLTHKTDTTDVERAENALKRAINRLRLVEKYIRAGA